MVDVTVIATAAISGGVGVSAALIAGRASRHAADAETLRQRWEYRQKRRGERQETYQAALEAVAEWTWLGNERNFDVVREFNIPFLRAANRMRVYGSPATIAALDEIQKGFARLNRAKSQAEAVAADNDIWTGLDHLVIAAREDVGPREDDELAKVPFMPGVGPRA